MAVWKGLMPCPSLFWPYGAEKTAADCLLLFLNFFFFFDYFLIELVNQHIDARIEFQGSLDDVRLLAPPEVGGYFETELPCVFSKNKEEIDDHVLRVIDPADFCIQILPALIAKIEMHGTNVDFHGDLLKKCWRNGYALRFRFEPGLFAKLAAIFRHRPASYIDAAPGEDFRNDSVGDFFSSRSKFIDYLGYLRFCSLL